MRLSEDLPVVIEAVDSRKRIDEMINGGLITLDKLIWAQHAAPLRMGSHVSYGI